MEDLQVNGIPYDEEYDKDGRLTIRLRANQFVTGFQLEAAIKKLRWERVIDTLKIARTETK